MSGGKAGAATLLTRRSILASACVLPVACAMPGPRAEATAPGEELYDSHIHFFSNDFEHYPIDPRNAREPEEVFRARITADPGLPEKIFPLWAAAGVTAGTGVQYSGAYKADNSYVLDLADRFAGKIRPEVIVNARDPESPAKLTEMVRSRHVSAARMTGFGNGTGNIAWLNSPTALNIWETVQQLGLPVGITFLPPKGQAASLAAVKALAERFPRSTIILEHMGRLVDGGLHENHVALRAHENVHFKFTTNVIDELKLQGLSTAAFVRRVVDIFGGGRIMWGSDFGNTLRPYPGMVADAIAATSNLTGAERRRLLHDNGATMFKI
ncbi:MAG: amidohydrolase [Sphingobium sp.]